MTIELTHEVSPVAEPRLYRRPRDPLLCDMELPLRQSFYPLGYPIEIVTNHPGILVTAGETFGHARFSRHSMPLQIRVGVSYQSGAVCPPEPTRRQYNHLYSLVADADNQAVLDLKTGVNFTWLTEAAVESGFYVRSNFLEKVVYLLLGASVVTDLHAACVSKQGKGILLCGDSGAGKSTLAYACARAGWTYTSDDTSYLINDSEDPCVIGHCHRARFRPSAKALFPELEGRELTPRMEGKPSIEVPTSDLPIHRTVPESQIHAVIYLDRRPDARVQFVQLPVGTSTERLRRELYSAGEIRAKHEKVLEKLRDVPTYEIQYCRLDDAIRALDLLALEL
jgi:energy-coupling factor transporter ATP-binding protein EcfA2